MSDKLKLKEIQLFCEKLKEGAEESKTKAEAIVSYNDGIIAVCDSVLLRIYESQPNGASAS